MVDYAACMLLIGDATGVFQLADADFELALHAATPTNYRKRLSARHEGATTSIDDNDVAIEEFAK